MRFINLIFLLTFSLSSMAFMSGIDPSRDTQGELEIIGATIPLAPASASVILLIKMLNFIILLAPFMTA
jgi:hypothetical protein